MNDHQASTRPRAIDFLFDNSLFLIGGAVLALVWANMDAASYQKFIHFDVTSIVQNGDEDHAHDDHAHDDQHDDDQDVAPAAADGDAQDAESAEEDTHQETDDGDDDADHDEAHAAGGGHHGLTIHFIINDILMALFFAIAGKEVWESMLPGGALSNARKAATPLLATLGGIVGPAGLYVAGALLVGESGWFGQEGNLGRGWAVPCATDIAFSYLVARLIFGNGHPAIAFLLLLAIADDAAGLIILAIAYPQGEIQISWFLLTIAAMATAFVFRKLRLQSFWWYLLIPGVMSWISFYFAGIHAALGLVPIIPCLPHAHTDLGIFAREELHRSDTLNEFEHWWKNPVELILGLFGLANAGVALGNIGTGTYLVVIGLLIGKPVGITLFTWLAEKVFRLEVPAGMNYRHIVTLGAVAGIGFTVALFVSEAAFPAGQFPDELRDAVKMGALASFLAAVVSFIVARALGIKPLPQGSSVETPPASPGI
jgi:NhaA family Na+:H+ antiporter